MGVRTPVRIRAEGECRQEPHMGAPSFSKNLFRNSA